jgi:hypothetical protein
MRLPDFITRAIAFFDSAESRLAKLETAQTPEASCSACEGSGKCDACEGSGKMENAECEACEGSGHCDGCQGQKTAKAQMSRAAEVNKTLQALVSGLQKQCADSSALLETAKAEVVTLTAALATEKKRANETIAAQGLPLNQVPASSPSAELPGQAAQNPWEKYQALLASNPRAAGEFWRTNADAILQAKVKAA